MQLAPKKSPSSASYARDAQWQSFLGDSFRGNESLWGTADELTPFFESDQWTKYSEKQRERLFWFFLMFEAEAFLLLERLLLVAFRKLRRDFRFFNDRATVRQFLREESQHALAFRKVLHECPAFNWHEEKLFIGRYRFLTKMMTQLVRWRPWCLLMPGLKLEIYSVCYGEYVLRTVGDAAHPWYRLHQLHLIDETKHVKADLHLLQRGWEENKLGARILDGFCALSLTVMLNIMLVVCCYEMLKRSLGAQHWSENVLRVPSLIRWISRVFPPYENTRRRLRYHFQSAQIPLRRVFAFLYW